MGVLPGWHKQHCCRQGVLPPLAVYLSMTLYTTEARWCCKHVKGALHPAQVAHEVCMAEPGLLSSKPCCADAMYSSVPSRQATGLVMACVCKTVAAVAVCTLTHIYCTVRFLCPCLPLYSSWPPLGVSGARLYMLHRCYGRVFLSNKGHEANLLLC